jgi:hypothetical protein
MEIAFCDKINFKPAQGDTNSHRILVTGFENLNLTAQQVAEKINNGYPFCAPHTNRRKDTNFLYAGFIAVDIDYGWLLEEVLALPFVKEYAAIVYTTVSHTPEAHHLRVFFELEQKITNPHEMRRALKVVIQYFGGDKACSSACQMFYGSKGCEPIVLGKILPKEQLDMLIKLGEGSGEIGTNTPPDKIHASLMPAGGKDDRKNGNGEPQRSAITLLNNQEVMTQRGDYRALSELTALVAVFCPIHMDKHASAFVVENQSGIKGVHCRTCNQSFWPEGHARPALLNYDFYAFKRHLNKLEYDEDPLLHLDDDAPPELLDNDLRQLQRRNQQHLSDIHLEKGIIGLISPTGTGKTVQLKKILIACRAAYKSVLVIGHRQLLLGELARNLGLHFYKDKINSSTSDKESVLQYLAICIDSMPNLLNTARQQYDIVIIDESEQVFRHLVAKTLGANRRQCYFQIEFFLKNAVTVIFSDADLGFLTMKTAERMIGNDKAIKLYENAYKPSDASIDLYESKNHLIVDMKETVLSGGRHYICCNSKATARLMKEILIAGGKEETKIMLITSENSQEAVTIQFLKEIKTAILDFDVLIASPSLGTGIDITFDGQAKLVDTTFGFFDAGITTHFDFDQQLARVRHPKAVKAWISPQISYLETDPNVIKEFCITSGEITDALTGYDASGHPMYDTNDKILTLYADVTSMSNASKNNSKKHFIDLKMNNGWLVNHVMEDETGFLDIKKNIRDAKNLIEENDLTGLLNAKELSKFEFDLIRQKSILNKSESLSCRKFLIEKFYGQDISLDLLKLDNIGKFRKQLRMMALFRSNPFSLAESDAKRNASHVIDRDNNSMKANLLIELLPKTGITDSHGKFNLDLEITNSELKEFAMACSHKSHEIYTLLGIKIRADVHRKAMTQLNIILNTIGMKMQESGHTDNKQGKRTFFYKVDKKLHDLIFQYLPLVDRDLDSEAAVKEMAVKEKVRRDKHKK